MADTLGQDRGGGGAGGAKAAGRRGGASDNSHSTLDPPPRARCDDSCVQAVGTLWMFVLAGRVRCFGSGEQEDQCCVGSSDALTRLFSFILALLRAAEGEIVGKLDAENDLEKVIDCLPSTTVCPQLTHRRRLV